MTADRRLCVALLSRVEDRRLMAADKSQSHLVDL